MRDPKERLRDMLEAIAAIERHLQRGKADFERDELLQGWFVRNLQILGEAARAVPSFCKSATLEEIRKHGHVLTPGRYVGVAPEEDDGEPFEQKMDRLIAQLKEYTSEARRLDALIARNLSALGWKIEMP